MNRDEIEILVCKVLSAVLKTDVDPNYLRDENPKWDSLKHMEIVFMLEDEFDLEFSDSQLVEFDSVKSIVDGILAKYAA